MLLLDVLDAMPKHSRERLVGTVLRSSSTSCVAPSCVIVMIPCIITYPQSFSLLFFFFLVSCITWAQKCPSPICNLPVAWLPGFFFFSLFTSFARYRSVLEAGTQAWTLLSVFLISLVTVLIVTIITLIIFFSCTSSLHFFFPHLLTLLSAIPTTHHPIPHIIAATSTFNTPAPSLSFCLFFFGGSALYHRFKTSCWKLLVLVAVFFFFSSSFPFPPCFLETSSLSFLLTPSISSPPHLSPLPFSVCDRYGRRRVFFFFLCVSCFSSSFSSHVSFPHPPPSTLNVSLTHSLFLG